MMSSLMVPRSGLRARAFLCGTALSGTAFLVLMAAPAWAADRAISTNVTETAATSAGDGTGPGAITVQTGGTVRVTSGAAVVVDSNHNASVAGTVTSTAASNARGIDVMVPAAGDRVSDLSVTGTVRVGPADNNVPEPAGPNHGIRIGGAGRLVGDIVTGAASTITVEGLSSFGIDVGSAMLGKIELEGSLSVVDRGATALRVGGALTGDIVNGGTITATVRDGISADISGPVTGRFRNEGAITGGLASQTRLDENGRTVVDDRGVAVVDTIRSTTPTVRISNSISGGVMNFGDSRTEVEEAADAANGDTPAGDDFIPDALISTVGASNALRISGADNPGGARAISLGAVGSGAEAFGLVNRGVIRADGNRAGLEAETIFIGGGGGFATAVAGGLNNIGGDITATAIDASAATVRIGALGVVPEIRNSGVITASTNMSQTINSENVAVFGPGGDSAGIVIDAGAQVARLDNSGVIAAVANGRNTDAVAVADRSNSLTQIVNSGVVQALRDARETGDTGVLTAFDLSASSIDISVQNTGTIDGALLTGAGNDLLVIDGGVMRGDVRLGGGANRVELRGDGSLDANRFDAAGGTLDLLVEDARIVLSDIGGSALTNAEFGDGAVFGVTINANQAEATGLVATGDLIMRSGARVDVRFGDFALNGGQRTILSAGNLVFEEPIEDIIVSEVPFLFDFELGLDPNNANRLVATFTRRATSALGLSANDASLFDALAPALTGDNTIGAIIANTAGRDALNGALAQFRPAGAVARFRAAVQSQDVALGGVARRLSSLRLDDAYHQHVAQYGAPDRGGEALLRRPGGQLETVRNNNQTGFWAQEITYIANQAARGTMPGYDGFNFGFALGADRPMLGLDAVGVSFAQIWGEYDEDGPGSRETTYISSQLNLYASWQSDGGIYLDATAGAALNSNNGERRIVFAGADADDTDDDIVRVADGGWSGRQFYGGAVLGWDKRLGYFRVNPALTISYLNLHEGSYEEVGADTQNASVLLDVDGSSATSLRGGAKLDITGLFPVSSVLLTTALRGGVLREFGDGAVETSGRFQGGGEGFSITESLGSKNSYFAGGALGFTSGISIFTLDYNLEKRGGFSGHSLSAHVRVNF